VEEKIINSTLQENLFTPHILSTYFVSDMNMLGLRDKIVAEECVWDIWKRREAEKSNQDLFILL